VFSFFSSLSVSCLSSFFFLSVLASVCVCFFSYAKSKQNILNVRLCTIPAHTYMRTCTHIYVWSESTIEYNNNNNNNICIYTCGHTYVRTYIHYQLIQQQQQQQYTYVYVHACQLVCVHVYIRMCLAGEKGEKREH